jgi:hypothetical protein
MGIVIIFIYGLYRKWSYGFCKVVVNRYFSDMIIANIISLADYNLTESLNKP